MMVQSRTFARFWKHYDQLPEELQRQADKQYAPHVIDITLSDAYLSGMEIHLTPEQQAFIEQGVRNGRFASSDDAMREAVTLLETRERELAQTRAFVREGLDDLDAGRYEEYTDESLHELFDGIKRRGRERLAAEEPPKH